MTGTSTITSGGARDEILASIRRNLATSAPFDAVRAEHHSHTTVFPDSGFLSGPAAPQESLIDSFRQNLESVGGHFTMVSNEREAAEYVRAFIEKSSSKRIAISDSDLVGRVVETITEPEFIENASAKDLFDCDLGITSAQWAIAETGTLVLESEKESHRLKSLVPPVHLCIFSAGNIRETLGEILELTSKNLSRTITFVTGASRTSDIELTLAIGVHGPGELNVIVIADQ